MTPRFVLVLIGLVLVVILVGVGYGSFSAGKKVVASQECVTTPPAATPRFGSVVGTSLYHYGIIPAPHLAAEEIAASQERVTTTRVDSLDDRYVDSLDHRYQDLAEVSNFGNGLYYFKETGGIFARALLQFIAKHPDLELVSMVGNGTGYKGTDLGYFVVFRPKVR